LEFEDECTEHVIATEESKKLEDFVVEAKKSGLSLVPALVKRMLHKGMLLFGFINMLMMEICL
jgi:snRNA-activating protein complex subunit 1